MSKLTAQEMEVYNQASIKYMKQLRADIREEIYEEQGAEGENLERLAVAVIINSLVIAGLALVILRTGILMTLGVVVTLALVLLVVGASIWVTWKWVGADEEEEEFEHFERIEATDAELEEEIFGEDDVRDDEKLPWMARVAQKFTDGKEGE